MGKGTAIQWCDDTVNPTTGCDGCELHVPGKGGPCYAGVLHETRLALSLPQLYAPKFTEVRLAPGRMKKAVALPDLRGKARPGKPWLDGMPRLIFVGDLGDVFSKGVPFDYLYDEVILNAASVQGSRHVLMLLTKQPKRMAEFAAYLEARGVEWPENVWAGTSVTSAANASRIDGLGGVPAKVRFVSYEPALGPVDFSRILPPGGVANWQCQKCRAYHRSYGTCERCGASEHYLSGSHAGNRVDPSNRFTGSRNGLPFDWLIVGGESGHGARVCEMDWVRSIARQCRDAGIPVFVKQLGAKASDPANGIAGKTLSVPDAMIYRRLTDTHGGNIEEFPEDLKIREFPVLTR